MKNRMTARTARKILRQIFPARSISCSVQYWTVFYNHPIGSGMRVDLSISVLPGFDGSECQRFEHQIDGEDAEPDFKPLVNQVTDEVKRICNIAPEHSIVLSEKEPSRVVMSDGTTMEFSVCD